MILIRITVILFLVGSVFWLLHFFFAGDRAQRFFRRGLRTDLAWWYFTTTVGALGKHIVIAIPFVVVGLCLGLTPKELSSGHYRGFGPLCGLPLWLQVVSFILVSDFVLYWSHRLFHTAGWWRFHAVHHSPREVDWLSALRAHPVNEWLSNIFTVLPVLLLGFNPKVAPAAPLVSFYAIFIHASLNWTYGPLRWVIASPVFHRWHHCRCREAWDKNFAALLPIWDVLFGTFYMPKDRLPSDFGIRDDIPENFLGQLIFPFRAPTVSSAAESAAPIATGSA